MEGAEGRAPDSFLRALESIRTGGQLLLGTLESGMTPGAAASDPEFRLLKANLGVTGGNLLGTCRRLVEELELGHRQILADMEAITSSLQRLLDLVEHRDAVPSSIGEGICFADNLLRQVSLDRPRGRIMVADDDPPNRMLLRRRLEKEGHEVIEAENGLAVLNLLRDSGCDLLLLDIMMPVMDGFQTLARMKENPATRELPVIMISALDELDSVARCIEMGADDYLPKPFNRVILQARIGASLDKKWLRDGERRKTAELVETLRLLDQAQQQLAVLASNDPLTGLANRRSADTELDLRIGRGKPFSVIYIDVDDFKRINDSHGHHAGDDVLKQIATRMQDSLRPHDFTGRIGGDEFIAMVEAEDISAVALRLRNAIAGEFTISTAGEKKCVGATASIGVATWRPGQSAADVLRLADAAMYEEKLGKER